VKIAQVIGPVVDVVFEGDDNLIPPIYTALKVDRPDGTALILEVEQHIGEDTVRCVAMESTDGLRRGMRVDNLERPIAVRFSASAFAKLRSLSMYASTALGIPPTMMNWRNSKLDLRWSPWLSGRSFLKQSRM